MELACIHAPIYTRKTIADGDKVVLKRLYKHAVPTAEEVRLLLDLFDDYSQEIVALGFLSTQIMRPVEVIGLQWPKFVYDSGRKTILRYHHYVYKAAGRINKTYTTHVFKEVEKPMLSNWLINQLLWYQQIQPPSKHYKLFTWSTTDALNKQIVKLRKKVKQGKLSDQYRFLLDKCDDVLLGPATKTQYRISLYSLRRFCITFHYWVTFNQDVIKLATFTGHSSPDNLLKHYIKPKDSIGLTDEMIKERITIDQFIHLSGKNQLELTAFVNDHKETIFMRPGQSTLSDFV